MKKVLVLVIASLIVCAPASADLLCIKKSNPVKNGKVALKNALVVNASACPKGYSLLVDSSNLVADGSITAAKLADGVLPNSISINPYGAYLGVGATIGEGYGFNSGISLPGSGSSSFALGFTLPRNYTAGTTVKMYFLTMVGATDCGVRFRANSIAVARAGSAPIVGSSATAGMTVVGGDTVAFPATAYAAVKIEVDITAPDGTQLLPGDSVIVSFFRAGDDPADTCVSVLKVQSAEVQYQ